MGLAIALVIGGNYWVGKRPLLTPAVGGMARLLGVGEGGVALDGLPARAQRVVLVLLDAVATARGEEGR